MSSQYESADEPRVPFEHLLDESSDDDSEEPEVINLSSSSSVPSLRTPLKLGEIVQRQTEYIALSPSSPTTSTTTAKSPTKPLQSPSLASSSLLLPTTSNLPKHSTKQSKPLEPVLPSATSSATSKSNGLNRFNEDAEDEVILSMMWLKGRLGAAFYNVATSELSVMDDAIEDNFNFPITKTLYRQCQARYIVTSSSTPTTFTNIIKKLIIQDAADDSTSSSGADCCSPQATLTILPKSKTNYDDCVHRINCLKLSNEPVDMSNTERITYLNSILNYNSRLMMHSLGILLKFIDANWAKITLDPNGEPDFLYITQTRLENLVMIDEQTYKELKIMQTKYHPSLFKFGATAKYEGMNLFTLLNRCQSRVGLQHLWKLMQQPTRDLAILENRFQVTEFFLNPDNVNVCQSLIANLKNVFRLPPAIINRSATPLAKHHDWKRLSLTLTSVIHIGELCDNYRNSGIIFAKIADSITRHMHQSRYFIDYVIDHEKSKQNGRFVVRAGVDSLLDELRHIRETLPEILQEYARKDIDALPATVETARLIYLPDLGFLLAISSWIGEPPENVEIPDHEFKCTIDGIRHYKSDGAIELDEKIGDIMRKITNRQSEILIRLVNFINEDVATISKSIELCAELDALLSFSTVARDHNYVKPTMLKAHLIDIKEGRHPLQELFTTYVPNDVHSGGDGSLMKIFSGPNACGKTVYMKQIALIIYMAHIGCYVPATSATIGVITNILTQVPSIESTCYTASSFLIDLRQVNNILYSSTPNSLIIMDEFGRGTNEIDGLALLASTLKSFIDRRNYCPHVFVATHMHRICTLLSPDPIFQLQQFEYIVNDDEELIFLYKLIPGSVTKSFAHEVAKSSELFKHVVREAEDIFESMKKGEIPSSKPDEDGRSAMKRIIEAGEGEEDKLKKFIKEIITRKANKK